MRQDRTETGAVYTERCTARGRKGGRPRPRLLQAGHRRRFGGWHSISPHCAMLRALRYRRPPCEMRWTWAADLQAGNFARSEFAVAVTNWCTSGTKLQYAVSGTGSRRVEDDDATVVYQGNWTGDRGNYSGGSIRWTNTPGARLSCTYSANGDHWLYLGTRLVDRGGKVSVQVDGGTPLALDLAKARQDGLARLPIAELAGQPQHTTTTTHTFARMTLRYSPFPAT